MNLSDATEFYEHISVMVSQNVSTRPPSLGLARTASEEAAAASAGPGGVGYSPDIIVPDVLVDDDVHAALDVEFLLEQGFTEDQIMMMCEGIREEALLRSKKTEKIRKSLRVQRPLDVEQEMAGGAKAGAGASPGEGAHMTDDEDDLSPEDKAAVADLIREKGYTEEQALQVHLQTLFTADELAIAIQSPAIEKQAIVEVRRHFLRFIFITYPIPASNSFHPVMFSTLYTLTNSPSFLILSCEPFFVLYFLLAGFR